MIRGATQRPRGRERQMHLSPLLWREVEAYICVGAGFNLSSVLCFGIFLLLLSRAVLFVSRPFSFPVSHIPLCPLLGSTPFRNVSASVNVAYLLMFVRLYGEFCSMFPNPEPKSPADIFAPPLLHCPPPHELWNSPVVCAAFSPIAPPPQPANLPLLCPFMDGRRLHSAGEGPVNE